MKRLFKKLFVGAFVLGIFACSDQDLFTQCIECQGIQQVCEGDEDGNGGIITQSDLEEALADGTYSQSCKIVMK